jgi:competence protein ComEC
MLINFYSRPIIPFLIALVAGITLGSAFPGYSLWAGGIIVICSVLILFHIIWKQTVWLAPLLLFLAVGYLSIQPWVFPRFPSNHIIHYLDSHRWDIVGVIDKHPLDYGTRQKIVLRVETLGNGKDSFAATGKMGVTISGVGPQLDSGDRLFLSSRIRSIRNFNNPGGFDYQQYMAFQGIWGSAYTPASKLTLLKKNSEITFIGSINNTRRAIIDLIEESGNGPQIGLLKALIVGDRTVVSQKTREAFNRAGVGHLLAISGLHVGIVASVAFIFFQWLLANIKPLLWKAWTRKGAALLSLLPVLFYGLVSGFSPSTQRAVIMISVFLMTFQFEREHDLMNSLALAALMVLVIDPPSLFSISFQLSFSAVLAIIYGLSRLPNLQRRNENREDGLALVKRRLITFFWVSIFAIGGTAPLVMLYFNQISIVGILANFVIVPCIGFIVIPLGLIAIVLSLFCPVCASWCFKACGAVLSLTL